MTDDGLDLPGRLAALADAPALAPVPGRAVLVRRRAARQRRAVAVAGGTVAGAAVAGLLLLAPLPGLGTDDAAPVPLAQAPQPERVVQTFSFPDQGAVAEVVQLPGEVRAGTTARVVVRVRTERGRVGGVDLSWGDGRFAWLDGGPRCTPDAGPTVVELSAEHVYSGPGRYVVRADPQVLTGCERGNGRFSAEGARSAVAEVAVR